MCGHPLFLNGGVLGLTDPALSHSAWVLVPVGRTQMAENGTFTRGKRAIGAVFLILLDFTRPVPHAFEGSHISEYTGEELR